MATVHGPQALDRSLSPASTDTIDKEAAPPINAHKTTLGRSMSQNNNEFPSPNLQSLSIYLHSHPRSPYTCSFSPLLAPYSLILALSGTAPARSSK
ncbi:hypothetical protein K503DRAFT_805823 [Rhizopogon vinicolor AM-OR11-026]|uniref:Uncharacterized protein n=1 Tax=Rhizopogon vinicolor AM-OR11-026 TaxID=1314800 RepID=A0A1B7MGM7_9AGAM|nr:hypothetical protein K503DRAFT_805823 [Rhizopogon vinicolor AM-OR11-026]